VLLAGGVGTLLKRTALPSTVLLTVNLLIWLLLLRFPRVAANPTSEGTWLGFGETLLLVTGGWSLVAAVTAPDDHPIVTRVAGDEGVRVARLLFAISMPMIGLSHFVYVRETAALVPAWLLTASGGPISGALVTWLRESALALRSSPVWRRPSKRS
jgi:hypothetical protein